MIDRIRRYLEIVFRAWAVFALVFATAYYLLVLVVPCSCQALYNFLEA